MVKATINFDDELYRKLIRETVEKYGKMRGFSKLVNEKLKKVEGMKVDTASKIDNKGKDIVERTFGIWNIKENGSEYVKKLRNESEKRFKRLGI